MTIEKTADYNGMYVEVTIKNGETFVWLMKTNILGDITLALFDMRTIEQAKYLANRMEVPFVIK